MKNRERTHLAALSLMFGGAVFAIILAVVVVVGLIFFILIETGVIAEYRNYLVRADVLLTMVLMACLILGVLAAYFSGRIVMKPISRTITTMEELAAGDYSVRLSFGKPLGSAQPVRDLTDSFNAMAEELSSTEILRNDFINNFSHEFKTPIVSIAGFARLLKHADLSEKERADYVDIIEHQAKRLSEMATNVLTMTNLENQTILRDVTSYNLSEQIRGCVLLTESKWTRKNLEMDLDFDEYTVEANRDLMNHVWINLLDNAIKFSPEGGPVRIRISEDDRRLYVAISNTGERIPEGSQARIFRKFYQVDVSHAMEGNGIGLNIVKRVIELHRGTVRVKSDDSETVFTVSLNKKLSSD